MAGTQFNTDNLGSSSVTRADCDTTNTGQAVITKVIAGTNVSISSTGVDAGTGDVTVSATANVTKSVLQANTAATNATTVLTGASWTMPANFATAGMVIKLVTLYRFVKTTSAPIFVAQLTIAGVSVITVTANTSSSAATSYGKIEAYITILTIGAGGTCMAAMVGSNNHGNAISDSMPGGVNIVANSIDTTQTRTLETLINMNTAVASNTITISEAYVEVLKI